eukprot:5011738-Prymnesium_polylepis.1
MRRCIGDRDESRQSSDGRSHLKQRLQHQLTTAARLTSRSGFGRSPNVSRCRDLQLLRCP